MSIAYDTSNKIRATTGSTVTLAHTVTGTNTVLVVGVVCSDLSYANLYPTGVTYNSVSMTNIGSVIVPNSFNTIRVYLYGLVAPSTGANNCVVTLNKSTGGLQTDVFSASYTGCSQTGLPDARNSFTATATSITANLTTVANNCWLIGVTGTNGGVNTFSAGTNATMRQSLGVGSYGGASAFFDTNRPQTPAGSNSFTANISGSVDLAMYAISVAPFVIPPVANAGFFTNFI